MPLARRNGDIEETIMVDIINLRRFSIGNKNVYVTLEDTIALEPTDNLRKYIDNSPQIESQDQP